MTFLQRISNPLFSGPSCCYTMRMPNQTAPGRAGRENTAAPRNDGPTLCAGRSHARLLRTAAVLTLLYLSANWLGKARIVTRAYELSDARIRNEVRIALVSDLHGSLWGAGQGDLIAAIASTRPHAVVLCGDLFDYREGYADTETLLTALADAYPCYFVFGNHEFRSGRVPEIRAALDALGISTLSGESVTIAVGETQVQLLGVDDGAGGMDEMQSQLARAANLRDASLFSILAIHCPDEAEHNLSRGFDLMLSGHTHGGQIRLPGLLNGLYAPGQGLFPRYAGGRYDLGSRTLIIGRGLSKRPYLAARIFNPPELALVRLVPQDD